jgi:hypothetical protein
MFGDCGAVMLHNELLQTNSALAGVSALAVWNHCGFLYRTLVLIKSNLRPAKELFVYVS